MQAVELTGAPANSVTSSGEPLPTIPFEMTVLPNGLTLIVHEDRRAPLVSTQLRFNVGSKDEPVGRTGFAHLFEHLMFKESAHRSGNWHKMLQAMGGMGVNGTTSQDRTNYYQTVPTAALDRLLWMESDRMGHLLDGVTASSLNDEVAVVKNEKRQREGAPYGGVFEAISTTLYPSNHPYGHTVLGSFEDLDNVNLETVKDWYSEWYGASNAVLVIAGDISFKEAVAKVEHWFGSMPTGSSLRRTTRWIPEVRETKRVTLIDRVPLRQLYYIWSTAAGIEADSVLLQLIAFTLGTGSHSRLVERLVDREKLCLGIGAVQDGRYLCGEFHIVATLAPGADAGRVEAIIDEEVHRLSVEGPTEAELEGVRRAGRAGLARMLDDLSGITEALASNMILYGAPDGHLHHIEIAERATPEVVRAAAARWLATKALVVDVQPFEAVATSIDNANRIESPALGPIHAPVFPTTQHAQLENGLKLQLVRRPGTHCVSFALHLDGGSALDPIGREGLARIALGALDGGTTQRSKRDIAKLLAESGIKWGASVNKDFALLSMEALKSRFSDALNLLSEFVLDPTYPEQEVRQLIDRQIAQVRGSGMAPAAAASIAVLPLIYGRTHRYSRRSEGTVESLSALTREMLIEHRGIWLDPARATLVVVGDLQMREVESLAKTCFGSWASSSKRLEAYPATWAPSAGRFFIDRPGGPQSALHVAMASPEILVHDEALNIFNAIVGGSFGSRLNANLRERKGWTYGAQSGLMIGRDIGSFHINTEVQSDRTLDALAEIEAELTGLAGKRAATAAEVEEAREGLLVGLPGRWATNGSILGAIVDRLIFHLSDDYHAGIEARIREVSLADVEAAAQLLGDPTRYSWIVAGDAADVRGGDLIPIAHEGSSFVEPVA